MAKLSRILLSSFLLARSAFGAPALPLAPSLQAPAFTSSNESSLIIPSNGTLLGDGHNLPKYP